MCKYRTKKLLMLYLNVEAGTKFERAKKLPK